MGKTNEEEMKLQCYFILPGIQDVQRRNIRWESVPRYTLSKG